MGICAKELREYVIAPCLRHLNEWSEAAENLLLGTAARESGLGFHLHPDQQSGMGLFQIQPEQHTQVWDSYLVHNPELASKVRGLASQREFLNHPHAELTTNLSYATAIAWLIYRKQSINLPKADDLNALATTWRHYFYNHKLSSTVADVSETGFILAYKEHIDAGANAA